jgi:hypothetical protein
MLLPRADDRSMKSSLTPEDLEYFQEKLRARATLLRHAATQTAATGATGAVNPQLERNLHELREIDVALERIDVGAYGLCMRCGKPVDRARLELFPAARFDICCMEKEELEHERFASPLPE